MQRAQINPDFLSMDERSDVPPKPIWENAMGPYRLPRSIGRRIEKMVWRLHKHQKCSALQHDRIAAKRNGHSIFGPNEEYQYFGNSESNTTRVSTPVHGPVA